MRHRTENSATWAQLTGVGSIYYIPRKSALLSLFKAARVRLAANSEQARRLSDTRIASATQEINQISDDIRDAKDRGSSHDHVDAATTLSKPADPAVSQPTATAGADLRAANSKAPDTPIKVDKGTAVNLSAEAGEGVHWRGDYNALEPQREIDAFVSQLAALGYNPREFRVTVRSVPEGLEDTRRCTVLVAQLWGGVPFRGKRYIGGRGGDWVDEFSRGAATDFPHTSNPFRQ